MRSLATWLTLPTMVFVVGHAFVRPSGDFVRVEQMDVAASAGAAALAVAHGDARVADVVSIQNEAETTQLSVLIPTVSMILEAVVSGTISCANPKDKPNCLRFQKFKPV